MKIFIDCIYTQRPSHCASHAKMKKIVNHLLTWREDIFVYWQIPELEEHEEVHLIKSDRIKYLPYPYQVYNRLKEYLRCDQSLFDRLYFQGSCWDADMIITNRTPMVPAIKAALSRPGDKPTKEKVVFLIEDMPMMGFKLTVPRSNRDVQSLQSIAGYLAADCVAVSAFWEKDYILEEAREMFSYHAQRVLKERIVEASPVLVEKIGLKSKETIQSLLANERPFTPAFCGRITNGTRCEDILLLIEKFWVYNNDSTGDRKINCIASTQSIAKTTGDNKITRVGATNIPDAVTVKNLPREEFWELMKEQVDVLVFMSPEEDYSMSLVEPMILGTPAILIDCRWTRPTFGPDYPFYVSNMAEAYALLLEFFENYPKMYLKWAAWAKQHFEPMLMERNKTYTPYLVQQKLEELEAAQELLGEKLKTNGVVKDLYPYFNEHGEGKIYDVIAHPDMAEVFGGLKQKVVDAFQERVKLTFGTQWHLYKIGLQALGLVDASTELGHMKMKEVKPEPVKEEAKPE